MATLNPLAVLAMSENNATLAPLILQRTLQGLVEQETLPKSATVTISRAEEKMLFEPIESRKSYEEFALDYSLKRQVAEGDPIGNFAISDLNSVVCAWLVGLQKPMSPVIPRSLKWIDRAIADDEDFGEDRNFHRMSLHSTKALGEWMENGWNAEGAWDNARIFAEAVWRYEKRPWPMNEIIKYGLDDYMAFAYQGGEHNDGFEAGIEMYERWVGVKNLSLSKTLKPREFGYALCLHQARQQFDPSDLLHAGRKMLQANLNENWLGAGQYCRAATWLKIVYWHHDPLLTPLTTILKAYDDMPNVPMPEFVKV